jgi:hypothetical protein
MVRLSSLYHFIGPKVDCSIARRWQIPPLSVSSIPQHSIRQLASSAGVPASHRENIMMGKAESEVINFRNSGPLYTHEI